MSDLSLVLAATTLKLQLQMLEAVPLSPGRAKACAGLLEFLANYQDQTVALPEEMVLDIRAVAKRLRG